MTSSTHPVHQMVVAGVRPGVLLVQTTLKLMSGNTVQRKFANMNYIFITTALITFIIALNISGIELQCMSQLSHNIFDSGTYMALTAIDTQSR